MFGTRNARHARATKRPQPLLNQRATLTVLALTASSVVAGGTAVLADDLPGTVRLVGAPGAFTDAAGTVWASDHGFSGGRFSRPAPDRVIHGTTDQALYRSNHIGMSHWDQDLPSGTYDVTLRFAEIYWSSPGARVFDVSAEGRPLLTRLDVYAEVGADTAYDRTFRVDVTDGHLDLDFSAEQNLPMVSAIQVLPVSLAASSSPSGVRPGSTNTGVPAGTALTPHYGDLTITTAGTRIDGMDLHGFLNIKAPDVTVTRSIIRGGATTTNKSLVQSTGARMTISDSTLVPEFPSVHIDGLKGYGFTASRLDISGTVDTALIYGNDSTIQDSWLHDNRHYLVDPNQGGGPSHDDNVQVQGGNNITLQHNSMSGGWNSAVQVTQDYAVTSNMRITDNWLGGGGCTVNIAEKGRGPILGLAVSDNRFARDSRIVNCPIISPVTTPLVAERNTWLDTGEPALVRRGA